MKSSINLLLLISFVFGLFSTCQKKDVAPSFCNLTAITMSNGRNIELTYNDNQQITRLVDYADTLNSYHTSMAIRYNSQNFFSCIEKYDNNDKITDSVVFEYPDNFLIKSIIYRNTTGPMIPVFYKKYYFSSAGLMTVDSLYSYNIGGAVGANASGYTKYQYNNNNNIIQIDYYDNPGNGFNYSFGWIYEYNDSEVPANGWINFIWTGYLNPFYSDSYILPLRYNMVTKEKFTPATGNYERVHSYEYDTNNNPVKEHVTEPGLNTDIVYTYLCK